MASTDGDTETPRPNRDIGSDTLEEVQRGLTVRMIMTPRDQLTTCRPEDIASEIAAKNKDQKFSCIPVVSETKCILGFYDAERWLEHEAPSETIENDFYNLSKSNLMSADSSILEFINTANELPIRFVTSEKKDCRLDNTIRFTETPGSGSIVRFDY